MGEQVEYQLKTSGASSLSALGHCSFMADFWDECRSGLFCFVLETLKISIQL